MKHLGFILFFFIISATACQSGKELHYFKQGDNYYRLKIKEYSFLSSSRYTSGYYDMKAVDIYFGEISRPDSAKLYHEPTYKIENGKKESLAGKKLVMLLSTNSDAVTNQISSFAENEQTLEHIVRLANSEKIDQNTQLKTDLTNQKNIIQNYVNSGDKYLANLDSSNIASSESYILAYLNQIAITRGRKVPFLTMEEAKTWYFNEF